MKNSHTIRILFVDDEPNVLASLKRMLRPKAKEWEMVFVGSGADALQEMEKGYVDVIVSDIRMPKMTGAELLKRVKNTSPTTIRIALSGQVGLNQVIQSIKEVHQYISKPCTGETLIAKIEGALQSRKILTDKNLLKLITDLDALPVIPEIYEQIEKELAKKEPSISAIAACITCDVGFVTKIIKLVNSPYFGLQSSVASIEKAVTLLGLDTIKALVLSTQMFSMYDESKLPDLHLSLLWDHCFRVSTIAKLIAESEELDRKMVAHCRMAGLLHDVGKLILSTKFSDKYQEVLDKVANSDCLIWQAEMEVFGTTHAEIGAYLMGLWGLPGDIVYGIGHHVNAPTDSNKIAFILHIANLLDHHLVTINTGYTRNHLTKKQKLALSQDDTLKKWLQHIQTKWEFMKDLDIDTAVSKVLNGGNK